MNLLKIRGGGYIYDQIVDADDAESGEESAEAKEVLENEDDNTDGNDDMKASSDEAEEITVKEMEVKGSEQSAEDTEILDEEQASETKSSLRAENEEKEENGSEVDNKEVDNKDASISGTFINLQNRPVAFTDDNKYGDFTFSGFGTSIANDHGPQSAQANATITFTLPGTKDDKVTIEVVMCKHGSGTVKAEVGGTAVEDDKISNENFSDAKLEDSSKKYTIPEVVGGSVVTLTIPESGAYVHSITAKIKSTANFTVTATSNNTAHGTVSADKTSAQEGDTVTLTVNPSDGYEFYYWEVKGGSVTITNNSFKMPAANVEIKAVFADPSKPYVWDFGGAVTGDNDLITSSMLSTDSKMFNGVNIYANSGEMQLGDLTIYNMQSQIKSLTKGDYKGAFHVYGGSPTHYSAIMIKAKAGDVITVAAYEDELGKVIFSKTSGTGSILSSLKLGGNNQNQLTIDTAKIGTVQSFTPSAIQTVEESKFYAPEDATYAILSGSSSTKKLYIARITQEHVNTVDVSGEVTLPEDDASIELTGKYIVFEDTATGEIVKAVITKSGETYSYNVPKKPEGEDDATNTYLYNKHIYKVSLQDEGGGKVQSVEVAEKDQKWDLSQNRDNYNIALDVSIPTETLSGAITVPEDSKLLDSLELTFVETANKSVKATIDKNAKTYTADLKTGIAYTIKAEAEHIYDYELDTSGLGNLYADNKVTITQEETEKPIAFTALQTYEVTLDVSGSKNVDGTDITLKTLKDAGSRLVFTRVTEDDSKGYEYAFKVGDTSDPIMLRDGTYKVSTANSAYVAEQKDKIDALKANTDTSAYIIASNEPLEVTIEGSNKPLKVPYKYAAEWHFTLPEFTNLKIPTKGNVIYNGLYVEYAEINSSMLKIYSYPTYSHILVPVKGDCRITFNTHDSATDTLTVEANGIKKVYAIAEPNGKTRTYTYNYEGGEGTVKIYVENSGFTGGYFKDITVTYPKKIAIAAPDTIENGTLSFNKPTEQHYAYHYDHVKLSEIVTAAPTNPDEYGFGAWKVTYKEEGETEETNVHIEGTGSAATFEMPDHDVTISATFAPLGAPHKIELANATEIEGGRAELAPNGITEARAGEEVHLDRVAVATPKTEENYIFSHWMIYYTENGESKSPTVEGNIFQMPDADVTVKPIFEKQYEIKVAGDVENGTVTLLGETPKYAVKDDVLLLKDIVKAEPTPGTDYEFEEWKITYRDATGTIKSVTVEKEGQDDGFAMPAGEVTISAVFVINYVAEGLQDFTPETKNLTSFKGIKFTKVKDVDNKHGFLTEQDAVITLNLSGEAKKITVQTCCHGAGTSATITVNRVELPKSEEEEKGEGKNGLIFEMKDVPQGKLELAVSSGTYVHGIDVAYKPVQRPEQSERKIDVWDFGGKTETDAKYVNHITPDDLKTYVGDGSGGTAKGDYKEMTTAVFGDLTAGVLAKDRLYTNEEALDAYTKDKGENIKKYIIDYGDGYTSTGAWYGNGSGSITQRYIAIQNVYEGDKIVAYMGSHSSGDAEYTFELGDQKETVTVKSGEFKKFMFAAEESGSCKIYQSGGAGKIMYHRIVKVPGIDVQGTIDYNGHQNDVANATIKLKNMTTKQQKVIEVAQDGTFSTTLAAGYKYRAVLSGVPGFAFDVDSRDFETKDEEYNTGKSGVNLKVVTQTVYQYSGEIKGFADGYNTSKLAVTMIGNEEDDAEDVDLTITQGDKITFTASLLPGKRYTFEMEGVNDYEIKNPLIIKNDNGDDYTNQTITVDLKPKHKVIGGFMGLEDGVTVTSLKFKNVADKYEYAVEDTASFADGFYTIELRDGEYLADAVTTNTKCITKTHVIVSGDDVSQDLFFTPPEDTSDIAYEKDIYVGYLKQGNKNYKTVNAAVKAASRMKKDGAPRTAKERITIHIAPGTYREQIKINTPYVSFVNDTDEEVKLTWYYGIGYKYFSSDGFYNAERAYDKYEKKIADKWGTSVYVQKEATAFRAEGITFESSFNRYITDEEIEDGVEVSGTEKIDIERKHGVDVNSKAATERATAIAIEGDQAEFKDCKFFSSQDTVYTGYVHAYFKNCVIEGMTDYIFGEGSNAVFDACELSWKGYSEDKTDNSGYITAHRQNTTDNSDKGYLFRNCTVTANNYNNLTISPGYWGRPWGDKAKVIFMNTKLQTADLIKAEGWYEMSGVKADAATLTFREYNTTTAGGAAVDTSKRASVNAVMTEAQANAVKVNDYFGAWTPSYYTAEAAGDVAIDGNVTVKDNGSIDAPHPGHTLTVQYSLGDANNANDASVIQWYILDSKDSSTGTLVKTSTALDKTYKIESEAVGKFIKVTVTPQTVSGKIGDAKSFIVDEAVRDGYEDPSGDSQGDNVVNAPVAETSEVSADGKVTVTLTCATENAKIYYTDDGVTNPRKSDGTNADSAELYNETDKIVVKEDTVIKAFAMAEGKISSKVVTFNISTTPEVKAPTAYYEKDGTKISVQGEATVPKGTVIKLETATDRAEIRYARGTDSKVSNPTVYSPKYNADTGFTITADTTIKAIAVKDKVPSVVAVFKVMIERPVGKITASPEPGAVKNTETISLECATDGAKIYYTTDGTTAPSETAGTLYTGPISLADKEGTVTIQAIAVKQGMANSGIYIFTYDVSNAPEESSAPEGSTEPESSTAPEGSTEPESSTAPEGSTEPESSSKPENPSEPESPEKPSEPEEGEKIPADNKLKTISISGSRIKIEAANLILNPKKAQYNVTVTYTYKYTDTDGKEYQRQQQLTEGLHYKVKFVTNYTGKEEGEQKITITGTGTTDNAVTDLGKFVNAKTVSYQLIDKKNADKTKDISKVKAISLDGNAVKNLTYTGNYITPEPSIDIAANNEAGKANYAYVYKNNVNAGKASVTVIGQGDYYGAKVLSFTIKPTDLSKPTETLTLAASNVKAFSGSGKAYSVDDAFAYKGNPVVLENLTLTYAGRKLRPQEDYTIAYKINVQKGTGTATIKGINNFKGSININYTMEIDPNIATALGTLNTPENAVPAEYSSKGARLTEIVFDNGVTLKENVDYKVTYGKDCKNATVNLDNPEKLTVEIAGAGAYKTAIPKKTQVTVKVVKGKYHIKDGTIVDKKKAADDTKLINAAKITDASGAKVKDVTLAARNADEPVTAITVIPGDKDNYEETTLPCHVAIKLGSVKQGAPIPDQAFDGVNSVTVTKQNIMDALGIKDGDFRIVSYKNNNKLGSATVTIEGTGLYYGTKSLKFKIVSDKIDPDKADGNAPDETSVIEDPSVEESSKTEESSEEGGSTEETPEPGTDSEEKAHTIWVVGDSTVCSFTDNYYYPRYGYGTQIRNYETGYYDVNNLALSGRSSKSFLAEENYTTLQNGIGEGDVLIIGFGHNDEKDDDAARFTDPNGDYQTDGSFAKSLYDNYVKLAADKGAQPILCTPIVRRNGKEDTLTNANCHITSKGDYAQAIRDLGAAVNVPVVDLTALTKAHYEKIGKDETLYLHSWTKKDKPTTVDDTHLNIYGAKVVAHMLATELKKLTDLEISKHITNIKNAPTKETDLVANPDYVEIPYTVPTESSRLWKDYGIFKGSTFGSLGGNPSKENFTLEADADKNMHIKVLNNKGKISDSTEEKDGEDGIAMYYYQIPITKEGKAVTFTLSAKARVNEIDANGQVAFGLMARDDMYIDKNDKTILSDYVAAGTFGKNSVNSFYRKNKALTKGPRLGQDVQKDEVYSMTLAYNGDGYACTFGDNEAQSGGYDFKLTSIDGEYQYIGMFVSRNADITFSDIKLTVDGQTVAIGNVEGGAGDDTPGGDTPDTDLSVPGEGGDVTLPEAGLKKGSIYGYKSVATFEVLEDMSFYEGVTGSDGKYSSYAFDLDGVSYTGCVQGSSGPSDSHAVQSDGKAAFKIKAVTDSKITFITRENNKNLYFVNESDTSDQKQNIAKADRGTDGSGKSYSFDMKAGNTYYFYAGGSKVMVAAISITK